MRWKPYTHLLAVLCCLQVLPQVCGQVARQNWWVPNGPVHHIYPDPSSGLIYLVGRFSHFGPSRPFGTAFDRTTGVALPNYARPDAPVTTVIPDGSGGWFIAGAFNHVDGQIRYGVARLLHDGELAEWRVNTPGEDNARIDGVSCLLLYEGVLYVGGSFLTIGEVPRRFLAAVDASTGALLSGDYLIQGGGVTSLVANDGLMYIGGRFSSVGGHPRSNLAVVEIATNQVGSFDVPVTGGSFRPVLALHIHNDVLYVGGAFNAIAGVQRRGIAGVQLGTNVVTGLDPNLQGGADVHVIQAVGDTLYIGGNFQQIDGQYIRGIAAYDLQTNMRLPWNIQLGGHSNVPAAWMTRVNAMIIDGDDMIIGGDFTSFGLAAERPFLARINRTIASVHDWQPAPNQMVRCLARNGDIIYAGGDFTSLMAEGVERWQLAAIDPATGRPTDWAPDVGLYATISTLLPTDDKIFVAGSVTWMDEGPIDNILVYDKLTGQRLPWYPNVGNVTCIARHENFVVVGLQSGAVKLIDMNDASELGWNAQLGQTSEYGNQFIAYDGVLYVRGAFNQVNGQPRSKLAALDLTTGALLPWAPNPDELVRSMTTHEGSMFLTGDFDEVGGVSREVISRVDLDAGSEINSWEVSGQSIQMFYSVHSHDNVLYGGGWVTNFNGTQEVQNLIAIDPGTGAVLDWRPYALGIVNSISSMDSLILVGGAGSLDDSGTPFFGAFEATLPVSIAPVAIRDDRFLPYPNPTDGLVHISSPGTVVRFQISDISGRVISQGKAASHLDIGPLSPGVYVLDYLDFEGRVVRSARLVRL